MIKIIHTSDVHLDASFAEEGLPPAVGQRRRESLREVFRAIMDRAAAWPADAVLIAGDLFEHERVTRDTLSYLRESFDRIAPMPVFISPGNCDPFTANSPYSTEEWPAHVHIFPRPEWDGIKLDRVPLTVYGFGFDGPDVSRNPFGALRVPEDGRVHVAVAHGAEEGRRPPGKRSCAPFSAEQVMPPELHYLALGHYHHTTAIRIPSENRIYYCGSPEPLSFSDTGTHRFLEVTIDVQPGEAPRTRVTPCPANRTSYHSITLDGAPLGSLGDLANVVRQNLGDSQTEKVVRLTLRNSLCASVRDELAALSGRLSDAAIHIEIIDETREDDEIGEDLAGNTSLGAFLARLDEEIHDAPDERLGRMLVRARALGLNAYKGQDAPPVRMGPGLS